MGYIYVLAPIKKMKAFKLLFIFISILLVSSGFVKNKKWHKLKSKDYNFSIEFPSKPELNQRIVVSAIGDIEMNTYLSKPSKKSNDPNLMYSINYNEYPDSYISSNRKDELSTFFSNSIDGAIKNINGELLTEKIIEINGYPGREYRIQIKDGLAIIKSRMYLVNNSMYTLQVITPTKNEFNKSTNIFLNSFHLKK
jgi:hypothetical protein